MFAIHVHGKPLKWDFSLNTTNVNLMVRKKKGETPNYVCSILHKTKHDSFPLYCTVNTPTYRQDLDMNTPIDTMMGLPLLRNIIVTDPGANNFSFQKSQLRLSKRGAKSDN